MWTVLSSFNSVLSYTEQWLIQGRGPGGGAALLFVDQTVARRAQKDFQPDFSPAPPPPPSYLRFWMIVPSPYLKVWIRHC